jgi:hypothetical protein
MAHALLRRITVDRNEDSLELQIEPRAALGQRFRLLQGTEATWVVPQVTILAPPIT